MRSARCHWCSMPLDEARKLPPGRLIHCQRCGLAHVIVAVGERDLTVLSPYAGRDGRVPFVVELAN